MKRTGLLLALLLLIASLLLAQTHTIETKWATVRFLESQPATYHRDTSLVRAYTDFVLDLIKKEPPDSSLIYINKAYTLAESRGWQTGRLLAMIRKASCQNIANRHYEALRTGLTGLKLAEHQGNIYFQGLFHRSLGNNYDMLDNYQKAIPHYEACLQLSERTPALQRVRAHVLVELGDAYRFNRKQPDRAKVLIEQAIVIYKATDSSSLGYAYDYYGQALTDLKLYKEAEQSFKRSAWYYKQVGKDYLLPELLLHQAELYATEKNYEKAIVKAHECLTYSQEKESLYGQRGAYRILYESNKARGRLSDALINHERFVALNDSINETNNNQRFRAVQSDYTLQTQQDQISQLTIEQQQQTQRLLLGGLAILLVLSGYVFYNNRQLRQKNRAISTALLQGQTLERQRIAADLHDNLGSTLSALRWSLEAIDTTKLTAPEQAVYATLNQQVRQAYDDVRLLSHNLLPDELAKRGLFTTLTNLIDKLNRNTSVRFKLVLPDYPQRMDNRIEFELYSICLELLNNTLKHAKATETHLTLAQTNGTVQLTISDNGTGLDGQRKEGKGLQSIAARVEALRGTWSVESAVGRGVMNRILVPLSAPARVSSQT